MRTLRPDDYRVMPWKNGQGVTTELVVEPPDAGLDAFLWRVSIAELRASGPFSRFAGYDRVIVQLDGPPMTLTHEGRAPLRLEALTPHAFSGDEATRCELDGVAHDFNLMARRDFAAPSALTRTLARGESIVGAPDEITLLYVVEGALTSHDAPGLSARDSRVEPPGGKRLHTADVRSVVLLASLRLKGPPAP